ncbi:hypothetical protein [Peribacillus sp. SCS-155]|uniref:hypothetical protein n=1 Tax=Peribacillus sedimenti TaxID=3115297 RepID=UPI00390641C1
MKDLIEKSLETDLIGKYNKLIEFDLTYSTETYVEQLINLFSNDKKNAIELLEYLLPWFHQNYSHIEKGKAIKVDHNNYDTSVAWFYNIITGNAHNNKNFFNEVQLCTIPENEYLSLLESHERMEREISLLQLSKAQENQTRTELQRIRQEWSKVEKILESDISLQKRLTIVNKSIVIFIGDGKQNEQEQKAKEYYQLKNLRVFSSLENFNNKFSQEAVDYIVFSTSQSKHSVYYQVKSQYREKLFHTTKMNIDLILDDLTNMLIEGEKENV